ncbi:hypothetical protein CEUSTIGMA_g2569.t1 [Chlamydomonas eustigma]|uniref:Essential protein Yae1 N-terminal domain-containing protein n=1 Tax=Chlamydomonas eustigma TaxID=1157962 RepID=A0A250WWF6_9CHLO|nr:hypothetical protein CEUSTIGMA_g2569.t1 [Chlamydomonas eustigma]|eukprot:GAX75125.1 hypothetical protein CEUSTIGMA_g2569.t1 [Chlamydomonas eustigma]
MDSKDDLFSDVHEIEQKLIAAGQGEGYRDGLTVGIMEGREIGVQKGYEIGLEVGFYSGCVKIWRKLQMRDPTFISDRALRGLVNLEELLATLNFENPQDERLQDLLEKIQGRFKAVASMIGCLQDYFPNESQGLTQHGNTQHTPSSLNF